MHPVGNSGATPWETPKAASVHPGVDIEAAEGVHPGVDITSLPLSSELPPHPVTDLAMVAYAMRERNFTALSKAKKNRPFVDLPKADDCEAAPPSDPFDLGDIPACLDRRKQKPAGRAA